MDEQLFTLYFKRSACLPALADMPAGRVDEIKNKALKVASGLLCSLRGL